MNYCGEDNKNMMMKTLTMHILRSNVYYQNTTLDVYIHKYHKVYVTNKYVSTRDVAYNLLDHMTLDE